MKKEPLSDILHLGRDRREKLHSICWRSYNYDQIAQSCSDLLAHPWNLDITDKLLLMHSLMHKKRMARIDHNSSFKWKDLMSGVIVIFILWKNIIQLPFQKQYFKSKSCASIESQRKQMHWLCIYNNRNSNRPLKTEWSIYVQKWVLNIIIATKQIMADSNTFVSNADISHLSIIYLSQYMAYSSNILQKLQWNCICNISCLHRDFQRRYSSPSIWYKKKSKNTCSLTIGYIVNNHTKSSFLDKNNLLYHLPSIKVWNLTLYLLVIKSVVYKTDKKWKLYKHFKRKLHSGVHTILKPRFTLYLRGRKILSLFRRWCVFFYSYFYLFVFQHCLP